MDSIIYALAGPAEDIRYIGVTTAPLRERLCRHISTARLEVGCQTERSKWIRSLAPDRPTIHALLVVDEAESIEAEAQFIAAFRAAGVPLVNSYAAGSSGTRGRIKSHEEIERQASKVRGRKQTAEARQRMSIGRIGLKHSEETKAKIGAAHKGRKQRPLTEEEKARVSAQFKGKPKSPEQRAKMREAWVRRRAHAE